MIIRHTCIRLGRRAQQGTSPHERLLPSLRPQRCLSQTPSRRFYASEAGQDLFQQGAEDTSFPSLDTPIQVHLQRSLAENRNDPKASHRIESYLNRNRTRHTTGNYGSDLTPHYEPNDLLINPPSPSSISIELLLASQTHMGHSTSLWNPANSRYIHGIREGIHIISLDVTAAHLRRAAKIVSSVAHRGGTILFAGTRRGHDRIVVNAAQLAGACHLFERWTPGSITNGQQILGRCEAKVVDEHDREVRGFEAQLNELPVLKPDLIVCMNPLENYVMLHECGLAAIPTIGIIDTDADPTWVTYPIPANDDSLRSVAVIAGVLGRAGQEGMKLKREDAARGKVHYPPPAGLQPLHEDGMKTDQDGNKADEEGPSPAAMQRIGQGTDYFDQSAERHPGVNASEPVAQQMERIQDDVGDYKIRQDANANKQARAMDDEDGGEFAEELRAVEDGEDEDMFDEPASADVDNSRRGSDREMEDMKNTSSHAI